MEVLPTDVLVLGGGLAALRAALAARHAGASVTLVVKGKLGQSGASAITTAAYAAAIGPDDDADRYFADTMRGGADIADPALVRMLCAGAEAELARLLEYGARFKGGPTTPRLAPSGDHSRPRVLTTEQDIGTDLTLPVRARVLAAGVRVLDNTMAAALVRDGGRAGGRAGGALCVDLKQGVPVGIAAGAVILATGGLGRLFDPTSNPRDVTGDGYVLGARAGAALRDMEFIQFYPWRCIDPFPNTRVSVQPSTWSIGGRLFNASGARFMQAINPDGAEATTRDVAARGIALQLRRGDGIAGGVRADFSAIPAEAFADANPKIARHLARVGIDHRTYPFIVAPEAHYMMGGLVITPDCATTLPGLFAAGEVAGGIHGANRVNSNAMPEAMVFGAQAGRSAAGAATAPAIGALRDAMMAWMATPAGGSDAAEISAATAALRRDAWRWLGIVRNGTLMQEGLGAAAALRARFALRPAEPVALRLWLDFHMLCESAELCLSAALARRESRGAHFRDDAPLRDDALWGRSIVLRRNLDGQVVSLLPEAA